MLRTHTCGELKLDNVGKEVILYGWVKARRDHGKLIFIDLRDRYGYTQVVFIPKSAPDIYAKAQDLRSEFVIKVKGLVNKRPKGTLNPKIATGEIEVEAKDLEIINATKTPPFEVEEDFEITEELRLKYRYLDLRRQKVLKNIILRHNLYKSMRSFLDKQGFIECETPVLTKSTPEGARDFLVPSRLSPGDFYALPQSPQLFKQIFMVAGIDRYYQIARCFRDEDLRQDRQPEFTQLDLEMSYIDEEDIFSLCEKILKSVFKEVMDIDIKIPFKRITYKQAMADYGSDKPNLSKENKDGFNLIWVTDFPLFQYSQEESRWVSEHHPFTAPKEEDLGLLDGSLENIRARSYDLVLNGAEIASGSIRIHNQQLQEKIFNIIGIGKEEAERRFGFLLEALRFGAPPHGGIAFGLDRLLAILSGEDSIREVIAFPKTQKGVCPLTGAPSVVADNQLKELNIKLKEEEA
jgi:aspartyl-tRNA synthetase